MSYPLWQIYHDEIPDFLRPYLHTKPLARLKDVGMDCGLEYTSFPLFLTALPYSRYEHSLGVALIVYHFTKDKKQALSGLFHDIATPVFAHVVDFLFHDYEKQEKTEDRTEEILSDSPEIMALLSQDHIRLDEVKDYHRYPIADNDAPGLASDRLEYHLGDLYTFRFASLRTIEEIYQDIRVLKNEKGEEELGFRHQKIAYFFTHLALKNSHVYTADYDRYSMEYLAGILRKAKEMRLLQTSDFYHDEKSVLKKIAEDPALREDFARFRKFSRVEVSSSPKEGYLQIPSKKRYINPLVEGKGRIKDLDASLRKEIDDFLALDFTAYIKAF